MDLLLKALVPILRAFLASRSTLADAHSADLATRRAPHGGAIVNVSLPRYTPSSTRPQNSARRGLGSSLAT